MMKLTTTTLLALFGAVAAQDDVSPTCLAASLGGDVRAKTLLVHCLGEVILLNAPAVLRCSAGDPSWRG
jgi:hypothetical protein